MPPREHPNRRTVRWKHFDYRGNATFFVTIVTWRRFCWFGDVVDGRMVLNELGEVVRQEWLRTPAVRPNTALGEFVIMPNHIHAVVELRMGHGWDQPHLFDKLGRPLVARDLGALVRGFKGAVTKRVNEIRQVDEPGSTWQRKYYEHIVRDLADRQRIERYIRANPSRWEFDLENQLGKPDEFERSFWRTIHDQPDSAPRDS
ncbi:MAG: transposase [Tepidiformaceae bacterium]